MFERRSNQEEYEQMLISNIFHECRVHADMYKNHDGIVYEGKNDIWRVLYETATDEHIEWILVEKHPKTLAGAMYYFFPGENGLALKNDYPGMHSDGRLEIDFLQECPVDNLLEIEHIAQIIANAHRSTTSKSKS